MALSVEQLVNQAVAEHGRGELAAAAALYRAVLEQEPFHAVALLHLGFIHAGEGKLAEARDLLERAVASAPQSVEARFNLGVVQDAKEEVAAAEASFEQALALDGNYAPALLNLGTIRMRQGALNEAGQLFARAAVADPASAEARYNIGGVLKAMRRLDEAADLFSQALDLAPGYVDAAINLANVRREQGRVDEAISLYENLLTRAPRQISALNNLGQILRQCGKAEEAARCFHAVLEHEPHNAIAQFGVCMAQLPIIYRDEAEIEQCRQAYQTHLAALCDTIDRSPSDFAAAVGSSQPFYLAYQGRSDRALQAQYGQAICRVIEARFGAPPLAPPPSPGDKIRVGIVSGYFSAHSNWKIPIKGWLSQLDRQRFRLFGFHTGDRIDAETEHAAALCDEFVRGPLSVAAWRTRILEAAPDVLIYPEVGMDPMAVQLAAQRLARVQCNSWGHPDTSGMPTLDYYLSASLMEPADGQDHYTEQLVSLPNLSIYYEPAVGEVAVVTPAELGCRADATLYWCAQSLYKYLPQYDEVFVRIAQAVGNCQFVFLEFPDGRAMTQRFMDRLRIAFAAGGLNADEYCVIAPRLDKARFLGASRTCHVFLDSIGWSGCNSTLESLEGGLPVVTLAGSLMRGRHSSAILAMMGVTETIATTISDYIDIATRLAREPAWRDSVAMLMKENRHRVYRDRDCITSLEGFLESVTRS